MTSRLEPKGWIVITSINPPTKVVDVISRLCDHGWSAVMVGDCKTPADWKSPGIDFLSIDRQRDLFGEFAETIPYNHYCRKNLGYLYAALQGARVILETDDDSVTYESFGREISRAVRGRLITADGWVNVYKYFTDHRIWPRGLPLDEIYSYGHCSDAIEVFECPVQQYLADGDPDVDAIYRLVFKDSVDFSPDSLPVALSENAWVPFNSQNTLFFNDAFPLLYLPCHVSFRMTDIWRSFVAQAALWEHGYQVAFRSSTLKQVRNPHNLMQDFEQEIVGYIHNKEIVSELQKIRADLTASDRKTMAGTAAALWKGIIERGFIEVQERYILAEWLSLIERYTKPEVSALVDASV